MCPAVVTRAGLTAGDAEAVWVTRLRRELGQGGWEVAQYGFM